MNRSTPATLTALALLLTPAAASAELVWRAPLAAGEPALQVENLGGDVVVTRPDGLTLSLSDRAADRVGAASCAHQGAAYLALGVSGGGGADLWIWDHAAGVGRLVALPAPLAARPAADDRCVFAFSTVDGRLGVLDAPAHAEPTWTVGALAPLDDPMEHPDGLALAPHDGGWLVGGAGAEARLVRDGQVTALALDSTLRPVTVRAADGSTWALTRRGALYAFRGDAAPALVARDRVSPSTGLVRWPDVGLAWGNAIGELVVFDGAALTRVPLSRRALDRALVTSTSPEGAVALVPTADGWLYTVYADRTWTRATHDAPPTGTTLTVEPSGLLLRGRRDATPLIDLTAPTAHLDDARQSQLLSDPARALTGHVMTSQGLELLDGVPTTTLAALRAPTTDLDPPSPPTGGQDQSVDPDADADPAALGCATAPGRGASPWGLALVFGLLWGTRRRPRRRGATT